MLPSFVDDEEDGVGLFGKKESNFSVGTSVTSVVGGEDVTAGSIGRFVVGLDVVTGLKVGLRVGGDVELSPPLLSLLVLVGGDTGDSVVGGLVMTVSSGLCEGA